MVPHMSATRFSKLKYFTQYNNVIKKPIISKLSLHCNNIRYVYVQSSQVSHC